MIQPNIFCSNFNFLLQIFQALHSVIINIQSEFQLFAVFFLYYFFYKMLECGKIIAVFTNKHPRFSSHAYFKPARCSLMRVDCFKFIPKTHLFNELFNCRGNIVGIHNNNNGVIMNIQIKANIQMNFNSFICIFETIRMFVITPYFFLSISS